MPRMHPKRSGTSDRSRRWFLGLGAAWSAALAACRSKPADTAAAFPDARAPGAPIRGYGERSPFEQASSQTPLHDTYGIITPSSLHFERHHSGVPQIDPAAHTLTIHGLVDRP